MRVLITGASGFVGNHIATYLQSTQPDVIILHGTVLDSTQKLSPAYAQRYEIDLRDTAQVLDMLATCST